MYHEHLTSRPMLKDFYFRIFLVIILNKDSWYLRGNVPTDSSFGL